MTDSDLHKRREILFSRFPPGQIPEAADHLHRLENLSTEAKLEKRAVDVSYDLRHHTLENLENQLQDKGFHLDNTLMSKLVRALIYYVEETQLHNLGATERPLKQSQEAYVQAWERHPHGDHDETPPEWREYK
ncbi:hypothetical protein [Azovibrio restrictus]|uniref:hypothetical protein n=1 Tax=Azovibrio restrictus TaxID=146938 RepID=UPI00041AD223|nr:hypothetical protein [Azovibrio restrictus]MCE1170647.1 hypothetical protein [Azovibrio sp.]